MRKMILSVIGVIALAVCGFASSATYCVIDLSGGADAASYPVTYLDSAPAGGWSDEYKTTKLVLKRCEPGSFLMDEAQKPSCRVTLTQPFYLGVFEVTQKQWVQVMGAPPPYSERVADNHPAHWIAYNAVRGSSLGTQWPFSREVDETSFLGRLRAKTGIDDFDLPTEAQWEYACRAGTTTKFSYGDTANREYMWYDADENVSHEVGTRLANPWGFYDMHGNVWEWCRDWYGTLMYGTDPCGAISGTERIKRGGSHYNDESYCHSSYRHHDNPSESNITSGWGGNFGFRLSCGGDDPAIWTGPEARVGATEYDTLQAAADAASDGAVIEVLREIRLAAPLKLGAKSLTFDGHGSRILAQQDTGAVSVTAGASRVSLSFRDISVANFSSGANSGAFHCSGPCDLVLSNCSLTAYNAIYAASSANAAVSVGGDASFFNASSALVKSASGATITLSLAGGTYTKTPGTNVAPGYGFVDNGDSTWTVFKYPDDASAYTGQTTVGSYTISIPEQLDVLGEKTRAGQTYAGSTFTLAADFDLRGVARRPIGTFNGVFDGNGHTISNFVVNLSTTDDVGFFSILKNATVKDLSIRGGRVEGRYRVGGIAGRVNGGTVIEDCTTDHEVVAQGNEAGGLVGYIDGTGNNRFTRCRTLGPVTSYNADERAGGLIGKSDGSFTADSCYSSGAITGYGTSGHVGGLLGWRYGGTATFTNSYSVSRLQGNYITQGGSTDDDIVGSGMSGVTVQSRPTIIDCFLKNKVNLAKRGNGSGTVSRNGNTPVATPDPGSVFVRWDNEIPDGEFNEITLYAVFGKAVASEADLRALPAKGFFVQTADITMSDTVFNGLHASPRFQGEYDGAGFAIKNLKVTAAGDNTGLFRTTQGAILKDIHLVGGTVTGGMHVGALIGAQNGGITERCSASTAVRATGIHAAGLIGRADIYVTIRECWASGPVESIANYVGGLVSFISGNTSRIENSYARGDVKGDDIVGGFIGGADNSFVISNCYSSGKVDCGITAGGFYARNDGGKSVTGCFWDSTKAGQARSTYGTGLATDAMFGSSAYGSWNADVWEFHANGHPTLKAMANVSPTPLATGCGQGTVSAVNNGNGTWTFTATPDEGSYFVRWGGLTESGATLPSVTLACDGSEAPAAVFGTCIRTVEELEAIWANPDVLGCYRLDADLDFAGTGARMTQTFEGVFDGNGHTISNFVLNLPTTDDVGLFSFLKNATVKNLSVRGGRVEGRNRVGGIAGRVNGGTVIEDCTTDHEVVAQGYEAGGLVGFLDSAGNNRFTRCRTLGPVTAYAAEDRVGGLFGKSEGSFTADSCSASGAVTGYGTSGHVGGLLGWRYGGTATFTNSYSVSRLQGNYITQGGSTDDDIVGSGMSGVTVQSRPTIIDCFPKNIVNLAKRGNGSGTVSRNGNTPVATPDPGSVFIRWDNAIPEGEYNEITLYAVFGKAVASEADLRAVTAKGFFVQTADITMSDTVFNGLHASPRFQGEYDGAGYAIRNLKVTVGNSNDAGLFRDTQGAILKNIHLVGGSVTGNMSVGGLVGFMCAGLVEDCSASVAVRGTGSASHAGGLVGYASSYATIRRSSATGPVRADESYAGGLLSYTDSGNTRVYDCYARGDVTANNSAGGFIAFGQYGAFVISNCYSTGRVTCPENAGGFYGNSNSGPVVKGCFWDSSTAGQTLSTFGTGLPTEQLFGDTAYTGWDPDVWQFHADGYPTLKGAPAPQVAATASGIGGGAVSVGPIVDGVASVTATPDADSFFVRWSGGTYGDGTSASTTLRADGNVSATAVFGARIRTAEELQAFCASPDRQGHYRLDSNLDLGGAAARMTQQFNGVFDGQGHTISNLVINLPMTDDVALFAYVRGAEIRNLSIRGGCVEGRHCVAGLVGRSYGGNLIEDCTTDLEIVANGYEAGGVVGFHGSVMDVLRRCRALGTETAYAAEDRAAGIVANTDTDLTIDSCYASGSATGFGTEGSVAGLVGRRSGGSLVISNSYSTARLQGGYVGNGLVGNGYNASTTIVDTPTIIVGLPKNKVNLAKRGNGSGTVSRNGNTPVAMPDPGSVFVRWDNEIPDGEFNEITLYAVFGKAVASEEDLRGLPAKGFFKQTADITMTTNITFEGLHNSPRFQGEYDGQGFEIRDLTISGNNDYVALFRQTQGAVLRNVILKGGKVTGRTGVAPLVGWQYGGLVERCSANVEVVGTGDHAAGLVGRSSNYATIRESRALGPVKSNRYVGGLVSFTSGTAYTYDCYTLSDVTANSYAGGFIAGADNTPVIHNCFAAGRVTSGTPVGGFYGRNDSGRTQIANNYWDKDASGLATSVYGTGLTTAEMQSMSNFADWNDDVWQKTEGAYPTLKAFAVEDTDERFTVTWENADGTTLAVQEEVRGGRVPQYQGTLPVKSVEGEKYFCFDGWSPKPTALTSNVTYRATFREPTVRTWMTVDLATGEIGYADYDVPTATALFNTVEFKTTKMAFRRVAAGLDYYVQNGAYTAQMTNSYYIGVFEVTVAQFAMMQNGTKPASYVLADLKAQGSRNRSNTRGDAAAPAAFGAGITAASPLGLFNARVRTANGDERLTFDLPTEAMWEVAARAASSGDLVRRTWNWYFGEDESLLADHAFLANDTSPDDWGNTSGIRVPGSRLPNDWGLFDMYGNARELCLDGATGEATPDYVQGNWTEAPYYLNDNQRTRGGGYDDLASRGRSSWRTYHDRGTYGHTGIRLARICSPDEEIAPEDVVIVSASITGDRDLKIPYSWFESFPSFAEDFDNDYTVAALMPTGKTAADGLPMYVWQDFVNGCDPTNPEDVFRALIEMVDGVPCVSWEPNLNTNETLRIYRILGKADLADPEEDWARVRPGHRFFKVAVEMPRGTAVSDEPGPVDVEGDWEPNLQCHLSFDDSGNDGLNVLKVRGGDDAFVRTTQANVVAGLGAIQVVTDSSILAGLEPGDGAVYIPKGTHLALPIPGKLLNREGHPYTIKMKVRFPGFGPWYSLLNMPASNDSDNLVYLHNSSTPYIQLKLTNKGSGKGFDGSGGFTANQWEELTFQFGESVTKVFLNGTEIFSKDVALSTTYADCFDAGGYFLLSADDDGDDTAMYWADVKVYDGIVD